MAFEKQSNKNNGGKGGKSFGSFTNPGRSKFFSNFRKITGTILAVLFVLFLLSGAINQVKTGQTLVDYSLNVGKVIGGYLEGLFTGNSPLKITEDGVYFKDADIPSESAIEGPKDSTGDNSTTTNNNSNDRSNSGSSSDK